MVITLLLIVLGITLSNTLSIRSFMSTVQDLQTDLQAVADGVAALAVEIAALKAAGAGAVSQEQLDALDAQAKAIVAATAAAK